MAKSNKAGEERIIIAGAGGQGIMLAGKILAIAAMAEGKAITWFPSYGAEVRGGTAHCMVVVSREPIGSPYIDSADVVIAMNALSAEKFFPRVRRGGVFFVNSSLCQGGVPDRKALAFPFTEIATRLGDARTANMVALGCYIAGRKTVQLETVSRVIGDIAPPDKKQLVGINQRALAEGAALIA